jgi:formate dehydrogenase iron-sulfur subunit
MPTSSTSRPISISEPRSLVDALLAEQRSLTAVERFTRSHERQELPALAGHYRSLLPASPPAPGQQYAFEVDLDKCSGCKACVTACHSLNGLDDEETWRGVGLLISPEDLPANGHPAPRTPPAAFHQHVTTACHHCVDPGCLNGCPVLAYDKDPATGIVRHLDDQCIGCQYCVMKCPYEVPQYSERLGIVRKCDLCTNRLAVGEAPACAQACPSEAIRISVVEQAAVRVEFRGPGANLNHATGNSPFVIPNFLPDSPDPSITLPTTRYVSRQPHPGLLAADHSALRLDRPHWPLAIMLVLTQAAAGLFLAHAALCFAGITTGRMPVSLAGFVLLVTGLVAAAFHLGQPTKAWRCFLGWRTSWLSREIIAFNLFAGAAFVALVTTWVARLAAFEPLLACSAAVLGFVGVFTSAMVYVDTRKPLWAPRLAFGNFVGTALLLGATLAAVILGWTGRFTGANLLPATQIAALAATMIRTALFVWRRLELHTAVRDPQNPIHFNARVIRELLSWTLSTRTWLFAASTMFGVFAVANLAGAAPWWASLAALATFSSEIIGRHVFFAASASKRMPGGVSA